MCDCRADIEKRLPTHYAPKLPDSRNLEASLMGYAITLGSSLSVRAYMPAEIRHMFTAKKTGAEKRKTEKVSMYFSHCPFCGEKLAKEENTPNHLR